VLDRSDWLGLASHSTACGGPQSWWESNREFFDVDAAPMRDVEMAQLVDKDDYGQQKKG
jgi:hypothetical protein